MLETVGMASPFLHPFDGSFVRQYQQLETVKLLVDRTYLSLILQEHLDHWPYILTIQHIVLVTQTQPCEDELDTAAFFLVEAFEYGFELKVRYRGFLFTLTYLHSTQKPLD